MTGIPTSALRFCPMQLGTRLRKSGLGQRPVRAANAGSCGDVYGCDWFCGTHSLRIRT
jgi:hypothetical protein